jgi:ABC-type glycerol-3-phosphate transport system substrate-binding protein
MKTHISLIAVLVLLGAAVLGMAAPTSVTAQEPIKLTFWNYWDGNNGEAVQALVDR